MYKSLFAISLVLILVPGIVFAQEFRIAGSLLNADDQQPLPGATIKLTSIRDSLQFKYTTSGSQGEFEFVKLMRGAYMLNISYVGFESYNQKVFAGGKAENLGQILIKSSSTSLGEVDIEGTAVRAEQKGDTTQYNAAAFKMNQDASTEDLIKKMPGITIENGTVKAQGEEVKKILVDGKQFFGDDPSVTLKNLPAEVVDKIQVFDKLSDQAAWTGFDDGSGQKTINIVTRSSKNTGQFGKFSAGYGTDEHYLLGANMNFFEGDRRITLLGMSNNINQQNFSADDVIGSSGRGGPSFQAGPQSGIFSTHALGFNYTDTWSPKLTMNASYFWNMGQNTNNTVTDRQYVLGGDANQYYHQVNGTETDNSNHRLNMRFEYNIDSNNSIIISPRISLQDNVSGNQMNAQTSLLPDFSESNLVNAAINDNNSNANGYNFNNDLLFRHKFSKKGRTASINIGTGFTNRDRDDFVKTQSVYYQQAQGQINDTVDQSGKALSKGISLSSNLVYTEPVGEKGQIQMNYNLSWSENDNDKKTYNYDNEIHDYTLFDTLLSNIYTNNYITHSIGSGYIYRTEKANLNAGLTYQYANLEGNTSFPFQDSTHKSFSNLLPNVRLNYKFTNLINLRAVYRARTNAPSISQLQLVIDNSNPLLLSTGNPALKQEVRHFSMVRLSLSNAEKTSNFFGMLFFQKTQDYIGNLTFRTTSDTLINGQEVKKGAQLSIPKNLDGAWNTRFLLTYGFPVKPIKCNINFNTGLSYNRLPSIINTLVNASNSYGINAGVVLSSNISEKLDFTLTYNLNYNLVENTIQPELNSNYFFQIGSVQFNWEFWKGFFIQNAVTYQNYNIILSDATTRYTLWNVNLGKKIFKKKSGEIKLSCYDILNENQSINHNVADSYIEDTNTDVLQQYFMLTFTYSLRKFNGKIPQAPQRGGFDGRPDFHQH